MEMRQRCGTGGDIRGGLSGMCGRESGDGDGEGEGRTNLFTVVGESEGGGEGETHGYGAFAKPWRGASKEESAGACCDFVTIVTALLDADGSEGVEGSDAYTCDQRRDRPCLYRRRNTLTRTNGRPFAPLRRQDCQSQSRSRSPPESKTANERSKRKKRNKEDRKWKLLSARKEGAVRKSRTSLRGTY